MPFRRAVAPVIDDVLDSPNCTDCLMRMEAVDSSSGVPFWRCGSCGQARVA